MISDRVVRWFQSVVSGRGSLDRVKGLTRPGGFLEWSVLWISVWRNSSVVVVMRGRDRGGVRGGGGRGDSGGLIHSSGGCIGDGVLGTFVGEPGVL